MQRITVHTKFDITKTNIIRRFNPTILQSHPVLTTEDQWRQAKNQQTNFETIIQILSLRTQPQSITTPEIVTKNKVKYWVFNFTIESDDIYGDDLHLLKQDCNNVPMISKMNSKISDNYLKVQDNIYFEVQNYEI